MDQLQIDALPFEDIIQKLEKMVVELESGNLSLENSMKAYEQGIYLVRKAQERLTSMEGRMEQLLSTGEIVPLVVPETSGE